MGSYHYQGIGSISGGSYETLNVEGVYSLSQELAAESLDIEGVFHAGAPVKANKFYCEGVADFHASLVTGPAKIEGVVTAKQNFRADSLLLEGVLTAEDIFVTGEASATGVIRAKSLTADSVSLIHDRKKYHGGIKQTIKSFFSGKESEDDYSRIDTLSAKKVLVSGYAIQSLSGDDVTIGSDCRITTVKAGSSLRIHKSSVVEHIEGGIVPEYFE
ncbi:MAG: hypothetical protein ACI4FZ_12490 [Lachnospiraceae bacterium]